MYVCTLCKAMHIATLREGNVRTESTQVCAVLKRESLRALDSIVQAERGLSIQLYTYQAAGFQASKNGRPRSRSPRRFHRGRVCSFCSSQRLRASALFGEP